MSGRAHPLASASYLEEAFLRWVLTPATTAAIVARTEPQAPLQRDDRAYRVDYLIHGSSVRLVIELDGFQFHSSRDAFTYDRVRQNDLTALGYTVLRFSYEAIRLDTARCVEQLQTVLRADPLLASTVIPDPIVETPEMIPNPLAAAAPPRS